MLIQSRGCMGIVAHLRHDSDRGNKKCHGNKSRQVQRCDEPNRPLRRHESPIWSGHDSLPSRAFRIDVDPWLKPVLKAEHDMQTDVRERL